MKRRFLLVIALACVALVAPIVAIGYIPAIQQSREDARREEIRKNLKQIGLALHNYRAMPTLPQPVAEEESLVAP